MPEILPEHVPSPRTLLAWDGTAYRPIHIDALGNVQIDIVASALPAGAATAAAQALVLAQLQLIEDIRDALQSVATDRLIVRGEDQLHSFGGVLCEIRNTVISGAGGFVDSDPVPLGWIWHVTAITAADLTSPTTQHEYNERHSAITYRFHREVAAFAAWETSEWGGHLWLDHEDVIRVVFLGALAGDACSVRVLGHWFSVE